MCLDPRRVPPTLALSGIPEEEHARALELVKEELIVVIEENRAVQPIAVEEGASAWSAAVAAEMQRSSVFNTLELADNKIRLCRLREEPLALDEPKHVDLLQLKKVE